MTPSKLPGFLKLFNYIEHIAKEKFGVQTSLLSYVLHFDNAAHIIASLNKKPTVEPFFTIKSNTFSTFLFVSKFALKSKCLLVR